MVVLILIFAIVILCTYYADAVFIPQKIVFNGANELFSKSHIKPVQYYAYFQAIKERKEFLSWFLGVFDNKKQAEEDNASLDPDKHAYVTAEFTSHPEIDDMIVAKYYFGRNTSNVFRFRYYEILYYASGRSFHTPFGLIYMYSRDEGLKMKIYRPSLSTLANLKAKNYDIGTYLPARSDMEYLPGCDIIWRFHSSESEFKGDLENGKCEICSQADPSMKLTATDELRLAERRLWIKDRVHNSRGELVIGHKKGIPYILDKIKG